MRWEPRRLPCHHGRMAWFSTGAVDDFLAEAGEFLRSDRVRNTVILTVTESLRASVQRRLHAHARLSALAPLHEPAGCGGTRRSPGRVRAPGPGRQRGGGGRMGL